MVTTALTPLRHLARRRAEFARPVLDAALAVLRQRPAVEAGRCVADMPELAHAEDFDATVVRHLIYLAEPHTDRFTARSRGGAGDASGLRVAATTVPDLVVDVLRQMLPPPSPPASLVIPAGTRRTDDSAEGDAQRGPAAAAVRVLAHTHAAVAVQLITPLILNQGVDSDDEYDTEPLGNAQIALATMLVWNIGDVPEQLESAGRAAGAEVRQRLFCVFQQAARLIDPQDRWREPGEPQPDAGSRRKAFTVLMAACLARAGGDWGDECCADAAQTAETLAGLEPGWAQEHLPALLGTVLTVIEEHQQAPTAAASLLTSTGSPSTEELFWQRMARDTAVGATIRDVLAAVERIAGTDATAVCDAVTDMITAERDTENGPTVVWKLLPLLGRVGKRYGDQPGVLRRILPALHTYILDTEPSLRSAALDAWTEIGTTHPLPSSLSDLLPTLLDDRYVVVINAVLNAAMRLEWGQQDQTRLLNHAVRYCTGIDAKQQAKTLKKSMVASWALTRDNEELRRVVEPIILVRAGELEPSDLADILRRDWSPPSARSAQMAALRLRQARDPVINDRFNAHDDEQLCDLLDCGPGLTDLPLGDLTQAAVELGPRRLLGAAQFMEVAWRAARSADAAAVMRAVLDITPDQPAYAGHRSLAGMLIAAADYDAAVAAGDDTNEQTAALDAGLTGLETRIAGQDAQAGQNTGAELVRQGRVRILIRSLLTGTTPPASHAAGRPGADRDPAADLRDRADRMAGAATVLTEISQKATATGAYLWIFAKLCDIAAQLLRLDAAELDADTATMTALATACRRRAALLHTEISERFDPLDPLAGPLATAVQQIQEIQQGSDIAVLLSSFAALPLPIPITRGPQRTRRRPNSPTEPSQEDGPDIAVVLASIDGQMITGPQVLRTATVYELGLQVQAGPWPQWADRLDAELLSHLSASEMEAPVYSWPRPAAHEQDAPLSGTGTLILRFDLPAGRLAPPFRIALRWRGTRDGEPASQVVDVAGHREIRLRPFDASRDYLTSYPVVDERLLALYERLHAAGYNEDHLQAFCRLFTAICRTGLTMTWNKQYKRGSKVTERKFHDDLYAALQAEPELGGRLERGSPLALGFLDVRHDGITAELKVERTTAVTRERAPKYMGQPTQYASVDGARLSVLCILDMSTKTSPIGTPENYLFTLRPALHGLNNPEAPSQVAVIIVNGNLPVPSAWSRRRTATQPAAP